MNKYDYNNINATATSLSVFVQELINPFLLIELLIDFYNDDLTRRF